MVIVTLHSPLDNKPVDLALPDDVPVQFIAEALLKAFGVGSKNQIFTFAVIRESEEVIIPHSSTLWKERVCNGEYLKVVSVASPDIKAFLLAEGGIRFPLGEISIIGRSGKDPKSAVDVDLSSLPGSSVVSHRHAMIRFYDGVFYLSDENSRNGTFLNTKRLVLRQEYSLRDGDIIELGPPGKGIRLTFHLIPQKI